VGDNRDPTGRAAGRPAGRRRRPTAPSTPRAIALGSGPLAADESLRAGAAPSPRPAGTIPPREGIGVVRFGNQTVRVEYEGAVVHLVLPDGSRLTGTDDEACELGALLLGSAARRP